MKKIMRVIAMCLVISALLSVSAFAAVDEKTGNGIYVKVAASVYTNVAATYVQCPDATKVYAVVIAYDKNGNRIGSDTKSGTQQEARATYSAPIGTVLYEAKGQGSATVNGTTRYGPVVSVLFS